MDPYILNKKPNDPLDSGNIQMDKLSFIQSLDGFLNDFKPDGTLDEIKQIDNISENFWARIKLRCITVIERGITLFKNNLDNRVEKLYLPAIEAGKIPDDSKYKNDAEELRFEDEDRLEIFFTRAIQKAILHIERKDNEALCKSVDDLTPETINNFLSCLSPQDKSVLSYGIRQSLKQALSRIEELYKPAIKQGIIPDTPEYNQRIVELGYKDRDELRERLFYFLKYSLCLTNWNDDDALRADERAFQSCLD